MKTAPSEKPETSNGTLNQLWSAFNERYDEVLALLPFHQHRLCHLIKSWDGTMPNVLLHGACGFPFFPFWQRLIYTPHGRSLPAVHLVRQAVWAGGRQTSLLPYYETDLYIHIELRHPNMPKDVSVIIDFLKHILPSRCIHFDKHIVVLQDIDVLCRKEGGATAVLKILLERFAHNVWFVCTTNRIDALEGPIQSRFLCVRLPLPTIAENTAIATLLSSDERPPHFPVTRDLSATLLAMANVPHKTIGPIVISTNPAAIRKQAHALIQQDIAFDRLCVHLVMHPNGARAAPSTPELLDALCKLEVAFKTRKKGRDIIYYEAALALCVRLPVTSKISGYVVRG